MQSSDIVTLVSIFVAFTSVIVAIIAIYIAIKIFRRTATLQAETFILSAYKDYMDMMYSEANEEHKNNAKTRFLMAIDLYCKYVINGHLDEKLSDDNLHFYEECIKAFKDEIKENLKDYNNIADYTLKYNISLE
ncbi:hypothetical protein OQH61_09095 [Helicobacter sp. MIT 21-1697]|uniref:hypothetical protein n=1 Tax=Helicobacter sp. MIT 21-1697 TaxID=2993733 RepID=UPI00224B7E48|nr:hypothetical protein [Helicobacter sp. MIT 21-1697]MCX2717888.1 hypothetical protein [Helicobacter sp. MIT 21-1697]